MTTSPNLHQTNEPSTRDARSQMVFDHATWTWSPESMRTPLQTNTVRSVENVATFGQGLKVFHDGDQETLCLRQSPSLSADGFAVAIETRGFAGSYVSLVMDLPHDSCRDLDRTQILSLFAHVKIDTNMPLHVRLNLRSGPNTLSDARRLEPAFQGPVLAEFDLAHIGLAAARIDAAWVDLISNPPPNATLQVSDLNLLRRDTPRF